MKEEASVLLFLLCLLLVFDAKTEDFGVNLGKKEEAVQTRESGEVRLLKSRGNEWNSFYTAVRLGRG